MLKLDSTLKMVNVATLTEKRVRNLKISELELMLSDIPEEYKSSIVKLLKTIFTKKNKTILANARSNLSQMIEQIIWIKMQKEIAAEIPWNLRDQAD